MTTSTSAVVATSPSVLSSAIEGTLAAAGVALETLTDSTAIGTIVNSVIAWVPVIIEDFPEILSSVETFVSIASGNDAISAADLASLAATRTSLEAQRAAWAQANPEG